MGENSSETKNNESDWLLSVLSKSEASDSYNTDGVLQDYRDVQNFGKESSTSLSEKSVLFRDLSSIGSLINKDDFEKIEFDEESWLEYKKSLSKIYRTKNPANSKRHNNTTTN